MRLALRLALLLPLLAPSLLAQERMLAWPEISVTAHLDADGRLHVRERQVMLFNGEWNGGERTFPRVLGQSLAFERLRRIDPATGEARELAAGDLDAVDEYEASNGGHTIRWRSRLPDDPPFANTQLVYELEFTYGGVVEPTSDGGYDLDHNFLFEARSGYVARFELVLTVDPAWRTPPDFTGRWTAEAIPPGEGFHVDLVLQRAAGSRPAAVRAGTPMVVRQGLVAALVAGIILLFLRLVARERRIGRWAPLPPASLVTREYLQEHVFSQLPEVVGAAWDDHTAEPEVAATLARLVQEKKLSSSVKTQKVLMFSSHQLHLKLEVPRDRFRDHERALIDALFTPGDDTTDTGRVRERYRKTGFDPASLIRPHVESYVEVTTPGGKGEKPSRKPTLALAALALALVVAGSVRDPAGVGIAALALGLSLPVYLVSMGMAAAWQRMLTGLAAKTLLFLVPLLAGAGVFATLALVQGRWRLDPLVLAGLVVWVLAIANSVFNVARSRQSPERIARRRQLAVARAFFATELEKEAPSLSDDWFPWIVAFGLGPHVDRWFKSFGGETRRTTAIVSSGGVSSGSSSRGGQQWTGFGGGGGFSGGGGGASFGAAIGGMAASVPKPSSGSSSGGGGGGSRSGGGGGGGW